MSRLGSLAPMRGVSVCEDCDRALVLQNAMAPMNGITYEQRIYGEWMHLDAEGHATPQIDREDHDARPVDDGHEFKRLGVVAAPVEDAHGTG